MNDLIKHALQTLLILFVVVFILSLAEACGQSTEDYYLAQGFTLEQIAEMQGQASQEWQQEHGEYQPNLTAESEKYLQNYTALLQQELGNGK